MKDRIRQQLRAVTSACRGLLQPPPQLAVTSIASFRDFQTHLESSHATRAARAAVEKGFLRQDPSYRLPGYCYPCRKKTDFVVHNGTAADGALPVPNWRETLSCPCGLINRLRASLHLFDIFCHPKRRDRIYITEQTTPMYRWLRAKFPSLAGSEYLGDAVPFGATADNGIRNESLTRLTFADGSFDHILSFDVFEHIPEYRRAFAECLRCLKPGGHLLFSVPFIASSPETLVRARVTADGAIEHLLPPEYHGDPLSDSGCLCFYHFGWDILDQLKEAGFAEASARLYWSDVLGYLGGEQILLFARKG